MLKNKGQLLIEILVALAVVTLALVVSMAVVSNATKTSRVARQRLEATKYAEKVLEVLRRSRDADPEVFFRDTACGGCGPFGADSEFVCSLSCGFTSTEVQATVEISWEDSKVSLSTVLTKYKL